MVKFKSVFDIIGPVMVGPSSSHTAGAVKIGQAALDLFDKPVESVEFHLYGSFAKTYKGHGTDLALLAGILGYSPSDPRIKTAYEEADNKGINYKFIEDNTAVDQPNTVRIVIKDQESDMEIVGVSVGGGKIEITELNGFDLNLSGNHPAILIMHNDRFGAIASVTDILAKYEINIGRMEVNRKDVGKEALMTIETDQKIEGYVEEELRSAKHILRMAKVMD